MIRILPALILNLLLAAGSFRKGSVTAGGFLGAWIDSLIGATIQAKYLCSAEGTETERRRSGGVDNTLIRGMAFMTNDTVNFLSGLVSTAAAVLLLSQFLRVFT